MNSNKTDIIKQYLSRGWGRRRIAKELGITEWEARYLIKQIVGDVSRQVHTKPSTKFIDRSSNVRKHYTSKEETTIKIVPNVEDADIPARIQKKSITTKVAVLSDIHLPYEDGQCVAIAKEYLRDFKPDIIVWNGDILDCYSVSQYQKDIKKKMNIQQEIDYAKGFLKIWKSEFSYADHFFIEGNHESRLKKIIKRDLPAFEHFRELTIENNLELDNLGIKWIPENEDLYIGNLLFTHGTDARKHAGASAKAHFETYGCSLIIGHIHRLSVAYKRNKQGHHALIENGTLCDFDVEYSRFPDWQHGFTTLEFDGDDFSVRQHAIIKNRLVADGKVYIG